MILRLVFKVSIPIFMHNTKKYFSGINIFRMSRHDEGVFHDGSVVKNLPASAGDVSLIPRLGRSPGGGTCNPLKLQPTPVFLPGKSHGQRSLADYSPGCHKKLDTTE